MQRYWCGPQRWGNLLSLLHSLLHMHLHLPLHLHLHSLLHLSLHLHLHLLAFAVPCASLWYLLQPTGVP